MSSTDANEILEQLQQEAEMYPMPANLPEELPIEAFTLKPALFQARGEEEDEAHIESLKRAIKINGSLDPVMVIQAGKQTVVIDGHHRLEAYKRLGIKTPIPVKYFKGSLKEAVLLSGQTNSKDKLPMTSGQRQDYAWRLVRMGLYSKSKIRQAAGVSDGQVGLMRRVLSELEEEALQHDRWLNALREYQGKEHEPFTDEDLEEMLETQAADYADRLARQFGNKLSTNPTLAAKAFNMYFGRKLPDLVSALHDYIPEDYWNDDEDPEF